MNTNYLDIWYLNSVWSLLSSISCGDKISVKGNLVIIEKNHPFLWMKRKFNGNSRNDVFQLIDTLLTMSEYHLKERENIAKSVISFKTNIILGIKGLLNLRETYIDDNRFLSLFNSSLEKMKILRQYYNEEDEVKKFENLEDQIFIKNNMYISSNVLNQNNNSNLTNTIENNNSNVSNENNNSNVPPNIPPAPLSNNHTLNNNTGANTRMFKSFKNPKN